MKAVAVAALALVCVFGIASAQLFGATGFGAAGFGAPAATTGGFGQGGLLAVFALLIVFLLLISSSSSSSTPTITIVNASG